MTTKTRITSDDTIRGAVEKLTEKITQDVLDTIRAQEMVKGSVTQAAIELHKTPIPPDTVYTFYKYNHDEPIICRLIHGKVYSLRTLHWQCGCYFDPKDFYINHVYVVKDKKYVCAVKTDERIILSLLED